MAIDRESAPRLVSEINALINTALGQLNVPAQTKTWIRDTVFGPAFTEIDEFIGCSRSPRIYLFGRSGHGKSSLLNALADQKIVEVGDIEPTTAAASLQSVYFPEGKATWEIIDSRGIFESTRPREASHQGPLAQVKDEVRRFSPDVILHVIAAPEVRTLENDLVAYRDVCASTRGGIGAPGVAVINKVDTLGGGREWPPEQSPKKEQLITELIRYTGRVLQVQPTPLDSRHPVRGARASTGGYLGIIPVCSYKDADEDDRWNIETLSRFIGGTLPKDAQLAFYQGQGRKALLRQLSTSLCRRFATIAGTIGATPTPFVDNIVIGPLQMMLVACIGGLSCRSFSMQTAKEFLAASGVVIGGLQAVGVLRGFVELSMPGIGNVISGAIAAGNTYGIGKAAEAYFFAGQIRKPSEFKMQGR